MTSPAPTPRTPSQIGSHAFGPSSLLTCSIPAAHPSSLISFSAILSALSFALDLTEGAVPGHALRSCILGMRIGHAIRLPPAQLTALYHALLLKDAGCSSNAGRMCQIVGGDDRVVKNSAKLQDWTRPHRPTLHTLRMLWKQVLPSGSAWRRIGRIGRIAVTQHRNNEELIALRCERGASIARTLGLAPQTSQAIHALDEHWDGSGYPLRLRGEALPLLARILAVAQHLDVFASERDPAYALKILHQRSGRWFDPALVHIVDQLHTAGTLWSQCLRSDSPDVIRNLVLNLEPDLETELQHEPLPGRIYGVHPEQVDSICEAFAEVVDAKSPFTYHHSVGVAELATSIATVLQLHPDRIQIVRRAALLHDLGKLAIPNTILDKAGQLSASEWDVVVQHPRLTRDILARIEPFAELAHIAGAHHEKLDGSGYPDRLTAPDIPLEARIIAVADVYQALTEGRPYREGVSHVEAMRILTRLAPRKLDPHCVAAVALVRDPGTAWVPGSASTLPPARKAPRAHRGIGPSSRQLA